MRPGRLGLAAMVVLAASTAVRAADPPKLTDAAPLGIKRGEAVEVTLSGANLGPNPRLVAPFAFQVEPLPPERSKPEAWAFRLSAPATVAVGSYPIRVQTDDGISNPLLFSVGQLPQVAEVEENNRFENAQAIAATPAVVEGRVAGNDVDFYRFAGKKGKRIVVDGQCARIGSGVDPSIRLSQATPTRRFVAAADDTPGLLTDARLIAELPEDGDYIVEISDSRYAGGGRPVYRLVIGEVPVAEEVFPLGGRNGETVGLELRGGTFPELHPAVARLAPLAHTFSHWPRLTVDGLDVESLRSLTVSDLPELREPVSPDAAPIRVAAPVVLNGRIDTPGDEDRFIVATSPGAKLKIHVDALRLGSSLDAVLQVLKPDGGVVATVDDQTTPGPMRNGAQAKIVDLDPQVTATVPPDVHELTLVLRDLEKRGGVGFPYRIVVEPALPSFDLVLDASDVNVPRGGSAVVSVTLSRQEGFSGPVTLTVLDPPAGLTFRPGNVAAGQVSGKLSLSAAPDASFAVADLKIVGEAQGPSGPMRRAATRREIFAQQEYLATNVLELDALATAPAAPSLVTIDAPAGPIEAVHGQPATIPVKIARTTGADAAMDVTALPLPAGMTVAAVKVPEKADQATISVVVAAEAPLGLSTLGFQSKGKFAPGERTIAAPVVALNVVRPVELNLEKPVVEAPAGATVELKGKVVRKGSFRDPVVVKVDGLPAGIKAEPATVAPEATDFIVKLVAEAGAKPADAAAKVLAAFQIDKKDYAFPPSPLTVKVVAPQPPK
ncbi:hypothetical protein [Paludisphaera rhizosphaerae]|nr:hypothetical protein [Paludisphaera rhizosphaerae]